GNGRSRAGSANCRSNRRARRPCRCAGAPRSPRWSGNPRNHSPTASPRGRGTRGCTGRSSPFLRPHRSLHVTRGQVTSPGGVPAAGDGSQVDGHLTVLAQGGQDLLGGSVLLLADGLLGKLVAHLLERGQ